VTLFLCGGILWFKKNSWQNKVLALLKFTHFFSPKCVLEQKRIITGTTAFDLVKLNARKILLIGILSSGGRL